ncbi:MAG: methyltransferase domain-containing protein [Bdellovibrionota bacterium]|jgi:tRNA (guanine6-N2)-methyltransferase
MKNTLLFEASCLDGTKDLVEKELLKLGDKLQIFKTDTSDSVVFVAEEDYTKLKSLRKVLSLYYLLCFPVKGPGSLLKADILADINLHILKAIKNSLDFPAKTFRINAAGSDSKTYSEIASKIEHFTGLTFDKENGDLLLRFRKHPSGKAWEVLIRLSSRPLSAKAWRTHNFQGALNPVLAAVLYDLTGIKKDDRLINIMCGSGTILIEASQRRKLSRIVGIDNNSEVLGYCRDHLKNANIRDVEVFEMDARETSFADGSFDVVLADLPWGENIGSRQENLELYSQFLQEAQRITVSTARIGLITQDIKNLEKVIAQQHLKVVHRRKVFQGGFHPEIFIIQL